MAARAAAVAVLVAAVVAVAFVLLDDGDEYTIHAHFTDAGLLVRGGEVKVAGRTVGSIKNIDIAANGVADATLALHGDEVVPLHVGTRASIRSLGAATITNRYVDLAPGSASARKLADGAVLPTTQTAGIVNLDALLDTFDADTRRDLQALLGNSAKFFAGSTAATFNRMLARFAPAAREFGLVASDLAADQTQLTRLVRTGRVAATTIAERRSSLGDAIETSAAWLSAAARERDALAQMLARAPATLRVGARTLADAQQAVTKLRPALRAVPGAAQPLDAFVNEARPALSEGGPLAKQLRGQLPDLRRGINGLRPLAKDGVPALEAAGNGLEALQPIFRGLRIYAPDFALGIVNGLAGVAASNYGRFGHYARLEFVQAPQTTLGGALAKLLNGGPLVPGVINLRTRLDDRCPGANAPPAPDGSSPIHVADLCDPKDDTPALVNEPPGTGGRR